MGWKEEDESSGAVSDAVVKVSSEAADVKMNKDDVIQALSGVLTEHITERRRQRCWKIFFRFVYLGVFIFVVFGLFVSADVEDVADGDRVAVLRMQGTIGAESEIDANEYVSLLDDIYSDNSNKAVLIEMNSPGGSPVHAGIIYDAIMKYRQQFPLIPVVVVVEDMAASGGYYIASAADQIIVDKASLLGSIGVISGGFEASELIEKLGVKRRIFTAGENKAFLDPFTPMTEKATASWQAVLDETHQQFIASVKKGRGDRLAQDPVIFSGMVFTGTQAVSLGLADEFGYAQNVLKTKFANLEPSYYSPYKEPWEKIAKQLGVEFSAGLNAWLFQMK